MSKVATFITVQVDPDTNAGFDTAPALVVGENEDGSLTVRVFGALAGSDSVRNYVGDDGEPFVYPDAAAATAASHQPATQSGGMPTAEQLADYTPEQRAQLAAELDQLNAAQPPSQDGTPGAGA